MSKACKAFSSFLVLFMCWLFLCLFLFLFLLLSLFFFLFLCLILMLCLFLISFLSSSSFSPNLSLLLPPLSYSWCCPPPVSPSSSCLFCFQGLIPCRVPASASSPIPPLCCSASSPILLLPSNPLLLLHLLLFLLLCNRLHVLHLLHLLLLLLVLFLQSLPPCRGLASSKAGGPNPWGLHQSCSRPVAGSTRLGLPVAPQLPHHAVPGSQCACHGWLCTDQESGCLWPPSCRCASSLPPPPPPGSPSSAYSENITACSFCRLFFGLFFLFLEDISRPHSPPPPPQGPRCVVSVGLYLGSAWIGNVHRLGNVFGNGCVLCFNMTPDAQNPYTLSSPKRCMSILILKANMLSNSNEASLGHALLAQYLIIPLCIGGLY